MIPLAVFFFDVFLKTGKDPLMMRLSTEAFRVLFFNVRDDQPSGVAETMWGEWGRRFAPGTESDLHPKDSLWELKVSKGRGRFPAKAVVDRKRDPSTILALFLKNGIMSSFSGR